MSSFKEINISNTGTSIKFGGNDLDLQAKLLNGVSAGIPPAKIKSQNKFGFWDGICYFRNQADSRNTTIRGQSNAPATDVELRLPPIIGNDVLPAIGLAQTWAADQKYDASVVLKQIGQPANPASGYHKLWIDPADGHLNRIDSLGTITDLEEVTGGGGGGSLPANVVLANTGLTAVRTYTFPNQTTLLAGQNFANVFTVAPQTLRVNAEDLLIAHRSLNTTGSGGRAAIRLDLNSSTNVEYIAAKFLVEGVVNTNLSESTRAQIWTRNAGTLNKVFDISNDGKLAIGLNQRLQLVETGLTAQRAISFPDIATLLAGVAAANTFAGINKFELAIKSKPVTTPTTDSSYGQWFPDSVDGGKPKFRRPDGTIDDLTQSSTQIPSVYDTFPTAYDITTDNTLSPDGKWRCEYRGNHSTTPTDVGKVGVRVPASPTGGFARVLYEYPYLTANTSSPSVGWSSASLVTTETTNYGDFDMTLSARTKAQRRTPTPNAWETLWIFFHYNKAQGGRFHHYYLALKSNGTLELGKKDNAVLVDEQYFLSTGVTYSYTVNVWNKVRIQCVDNGTGNHIQIWIDDVLKIDLVDDGSGGAQGGAPNTPAAPSIYLYSGIFGLYNEDAEVEFSPMTITKLTTVTDAVTTYSSAGANGVPIILEKEGQDLPFKSIVQASEKVFVFDNPLTKAIEIDIVESALDVANMIHGDLATAPLDTLGEPTDITTLNATTSKHGLLRKLDNNATHFLDGQGNWGVAGGSPVLDRSVSTQDVTNTVTETSIYSYSVPGGTLSTNLMLRLTLICDYKNNAATSESFTIKVKYGATTIYNDGTNTIGNTSAVHPVEMRIELSANGATNAQRLGGLITVGDAGGTTSGLGDLADDEITANTSLGGSATEDSTAAKTLDVTVTHSLADTNISFKRHIAILEII